MLWWILEVGLVGIESDCMPVALQVEPDLILNMPGSAAKSQARLV